MNKPSPQVSVHDLTIRFGDFTAVNGISFDVHAGEIFGFLGANGAGKTTTIRVLCGLLPPTSGEALVCGESWINGPDGIKKNVGYMSQKFTLYNDLTIDQNLAFIACLRRLPDSVFKEREKKLFDFLGSRLSGKTLVADLPGGLKQQVALLACLLHDPPLVFLDEPTAGVSPSSRVRFWELIRSLAAAGKTIFVTTHYMDEAEYCHRIAFMSSGTIVALGSPKELKNKYFPASHAGTEPSLEDVFIRAVEEYEK